MDGGATGVVGVFDLRRGGRGVSGAEGKTFAQRGRVYVRFRQSRHRNGDRRGRAHLGTTPRGRYGSRLVPAGRVDYLLSKTWSGVFSVGAGMGKGAKGARAREGR